MWDSCFLCCTVLTTIIQKKYNAAFIVGFTAIVSERLSFRLSFRPLYKCPLLSCFFAQNRIILRNRTVMGLRGCSTVAQGLALLPYSKKVLGSTPKLGAGSFCVESMDRSQSMKLHLSIVTNIVVLTSQFIKHAIIRLCNVIHVILNRKTVFPHSHFCFCGNIYFFISVLNHLGKYSLQFFFFKQTLMSATFPYKMYLYTFFGLLTEHKENMS